MIFNTLWAYIYYLVLISCCGYAVFRGARSEHIGAAIMIIGSLSTLAVGRLIGTTWSGLESSIFTIDVVVLIALMYLAFTSDRFWPLWMTAFQLLAVTVHLAILVAPQITPWALGTGAVFWAYPMLLVLAIGSNEHVTLRPEHKLDPG